MGWITKVTMPARMRTFLYIKDGSGLLLFTGYRGASSPEINQLKHEAHFHPVSW
jgi:hypothetical protein